MQMLFAAMYVDWCCSTHNGRQGYLSLLCCTATAHYAHKMATATTVDKVT